MISTDVHFLLTSVVGCRGHTGNQVAAIGNEVRRGRGLMLFLCRGKTVWYDVVLVFSMIVDYLQKKLAKVHP